MTLHTERDGSVVTLRIDNPAQRGSLDIPTAAAMRAACAELREDRSVRVVVVAGTGDSFCSGADLGAVRDAASGVLPRRELLLRYYGAFLDVRDLPQPTIAAVGGPAVGAGLNLALACDVRVAAASARLGATFVRLGIHPGGGATYMLARLCGPAFAAELALTGELVGAERAREMGLVNRVVADADLGTAVATLAASMAVGSPGVVRMTKRALRVAQDAEFATVLDLEALAQAASQEAEDAAEGWAAFRERRPPRFRDS